MLIDDDLPESVLLQRLIEKLYAAEDTTGVFRAFCETVHDMGFEGAMLASRVSGPGWRHEISESAYPEDWVRHYVESGYIQTDPLRKYGLVMARPYCWSDLYPRIRKKEMQIFHEAREFGFAGGVLIPLYEGPNLVGGVGVASSRGDAENRKLLRSMDIAGQLFVTVYEDMVRREQGNIVEDPSAARLTKTELDILNRMAQGATNSEIAETTHISLNSVEYHVRNVMLKLKAKNRVAAVVMGIKWGFVALE